MTERNTPLGSSGRVTIKQWAEKGAELFGTDDRRKWRFICPACGHVASIEKAAAEFPEAKGRKWNPTSECIGRYTDKVDCDWAAYGLFCGPLFVVDEDGDEIKAFDFEGKPFTSEPSRPGDGSVRKPDPLPPMDAI